jgi:dCMP deaminase
MMDNRKDEYLMGFADHAAKGSYCKRRQVGAAIAVDGRSVMTGYNGTVSGLPNECEDENGETSEFTVHAEQNAIAQCAKFGVPTKGATMYVTLSPCKTCAKLIASCGISRVVIREKYKDLSGVNYLARCGVKVSFLN